ncbi:MAG: hypothetical protein WCK96_09950 [Methylococcales bacterium]
MTNNPINSSYEKIIEVATEILDNSSDDNELDDKIVNYNRLSIIQSTKNTVDRMMRYALKNTDINLDNEFLTNTVSVLRKQSKDFAVEDEVILWSSYQRFSILVKPATDDSILIAESLNLNVCQDVIKYSWLNCFEFWKKPKSNLEKSVNKCILDLCFIIITLIFSITFYVVIQAGCGSLSRTLNFSDIVYKEWNTENNFSNELKNSVNNTSNTANQNDKLLVLDYRYAASLQILANEINRIIIFRDPDGSYQAMMQEYCQDIMKNAHNPIYLQTCNIILKTHGELLYSIISQYLLPLILGIIGSTAYISRNILEQLQTNSYLPTVQGKMAMRIFLGGLLGVITGIFISSNTTTELKEFNLNLVMLSLIMGYSVDVAFSLFDQVVERMKEWTDSLKSKQSIIQERTNT